MRTLFAVNQWLCNIFSLAPPTISRPPLAQYSPFSCDASAGRLPPSTKPLSARFRTDFAVNPSAESITHFEWLRTSALATSVSGAFLSPISLPRRLRNVFACMGAIEAGSAGGLARPPLYHPLTVAEAPALKATAVLRNFRGFRRRAPRMGTAWGCAHGCEAAASLPASGGTSCAFPTERGPTPLRRELPAAHPFRRAGRCAGSTSLPAPACRPTPALEQGGGACGNGTDAGRRRAGPALHRSLMVPNSPIRAGRRCGRRGREGGIPVAGGAPPRGLGLTLWWAQAARARPASPHRSARPPARPPRCARTPHADGWRYTSGAGGVADIVGVRYFISLRNAGGNGGWKRRAGHVGAKIWHAGGIEVTQQGGRGGAERGLAGSTRLAAHAPPISKMAGGNGGRDACARRFSM
ncbi:hypothetical protein B0H14DRAFT_2629097 [Mycena olivaceomarginata]|nr:hypothetical protein B0H14DRAFT_2629097 [Mycena olivaceomarginata]